MAPAIRDHTVLPATRHKWTRPALTPSSKLVPDLPTPEGWKAELTNAPAGSQTRDHEFDSLTLYYAVAPAVPTFLISAIS